MAARGNHLKPLAIFAPVIGRWGQSWVKAHIETILPQQTVVVAICAYEPVAPFWGTDAPLSYLPPNLPPVFAAPDNQKPILARLPEDHRQRFWHPDHQQQIRDFLIHHGVQAILAQWMDVHAPLLDIARDLGLRYYCQTHGTDITDGLRNPAVRAAYQLYLAADGVIAPSEFGRRQLIELGLPAEKTHVIRHAVAIPNAAVSHAEQSIHCLVIGRMEAMKGHVLALDAFRRARELCPELPLTLEFLGDGALLPALQQLTRAYQLEDSVTFHGFLSHDKALERVRACQILLHPSVAVADRYDTCPVTVAEAMAHGLAIVGSRHGGITEQIRDGKSGFLVPEFDTVAMADRLVTLARDAALRGRLGAAARQRARELFSLESVRRQWLELLQLNTFAAGIGPTAV